MNQPKEARKKGELDDDCGGGFVMYIQSCNAVGLIGLACLSQCEVRSTVMYVYTH
jgi:hypothetical protein